jgi:YD repeat-containing protein
MMLNISEKKRASKALMFVTISLLALFADKAFAANGSVTYTYDALGRVLTANYDTGVIVIYTYDANGNRTQQVINVNTATLCWNTTSGCSPTLKTAIWDQGLWH